MWWLSAGGRGPRGDSGVLVAAGTVVLLVGCFAAAGVPARLAGARFGVVAVLVAGFALAAGDLAAALGTALVGWLFFDGFLLERYGVLRWHGSADAVRLGVLGAVAVGGTGFGWLVRIVRGRSVRVVVVMPDQPAVRRALPRPPLPRLTERSHVKSGSGQLPRLRGTGAENGRSRTA